MIRFADSHCHLTMADAETALERAREQGVRGFVVPGTKLEDAPQALDIAKNNDDVWAAVGFHPHEAKDCDDVAFATIEELAKSDRVVAIGEVGLDYHYMHSPRETQIAAFRGRDNEPAYVIKIAELLASLWGEPLERMAEETTANFERAFGVRVAQ